MAHRFPERQAATALMDTVTAFTCFLVSFCGEEGGGVELKAVWYLMGIGNISEDVFNVDGL